MKEMLLMMHEENNNGGTAARRKIFDNHNPRGTAQSKLLRKLTFDRMLFMR